MVGLVDRVLWTGVAGLVYLVVGRRDGRWGLEVVLPVGEVQMIVDMVMLSEVVEGWRRAGPWSRS
jgi:hypothetical protein